MYRQLLSTYTQNIYSGCFKTRGMSVSSYTSFPLFRTLWSPVGNPALMRFSGSRQGFFALTERLNLARTLAGGCLAIMAILSEFSCAWERILLNFFTIEIPCQVYLSVLSRCHALTATADTHDCTPVEGLLCVTWKVWGSAGRGGEGGVSNKPWP